MNSRIHVANAHRKRLWPGHVNERMALVETFVSDSPIRTSSERVESTATILAFLTAWWSLVRNSLRLIAAADGVIIVTHNIMTSN